MSTLVALPDDAVVKLHPLHLGPVEDDEQEVGRPETGVFVSLPVPGVDIIKWLNEGLTVGEVKSRFAERYGEAPDLDDFVGTLRECGFVQGDDGVAAAASIDQAAQTSGARRGWRLFGDLPQRKVAWLVSRPVRRLALLPWLAIPVVLAARPDLVPSAASAWLPYGVTVNLLALTGIGWALTFLHEVAHLLAVRARGCAGYLQLSHRLHFVVAQTDMTAVRSIPREERYAPYLAGMVFDATVLTGALVSQIANAGGPWPGTVAFLAAVHLLFQLAFFMRTDIYYVIGNRFRLGNLMGDARALLGNRLRALVGKPAASDLSGVPDREMRFVRWYALLLVAGVGVTIGQFFFYGLPIMARFGTESFSALSGGPGGAGFWDGVAFLGTTALNFGLLFYVIVRDRRAARVGVGRSDRRSA
ncbi:MAG TPA: PqqD family protein [Actinomycetota bacterium]|nr:PqqD family protein [Actinomycetota bacterium]